MRRRTPAQHSTLPLFQTAITSTALSDAGAGARKGVPSWYCARFMTRDCARRRQVMRSSSQCARSSCWLRLRLFPARKESRAGVRMSDCGPDRRS